MCLRAKVVERAPRRRLGNLSRRLRATISRGDMLQACDTANGGPE